MILGATTQSFGDAVAADMSWWVVLDLLVIMTVTGLLVLRDLSASNRPFDWLPVVISGPFVLLVLIQSVLVAAVLLLLVGFGRATLRYGADALWVALAGMSLLKSLPVGKAEDGQRLWSLADWLFKKFYRSLSLLIVRQSNVFKETLLGVYASDPKRFLDDAVSLMAAIESPADAATDAQDVSARFASLQTPAEQITYLANWVTPRTTGNEWRRLTGR